MAMENLELKFNQALLNSLVLSVAASSAEQRNLAVC
jgi:hypothetical protein